LHEDDDAIYLGAKEQADGMWVKYEDYARIKEEAERYRLASIRVDVGELHAQFNRALFDETVAENARLKAEVERLTKAGDAMAEICFYQEPIAVQAWLFAKTKEGKQP
jgi:hypothetical protein